LFIILIAPEFVLSSEGVDVEAERALVSQLVLGEEPIAAEAAEELAEFPVDSLVAWISGFDGYPQPDTVGQPLRFTHHISDSLEAPYYIYVPTGYDVSRPTPLLIYLHGGVSRPEFEEVPQEEWEDHDIVKMCEAEGWLGLFPMARRDCLWLNRTGMDHLLWLVRDIKRRFNVDDDRVVMGGFSDGGSGSFHMALLAPTDMAHFYPWSGNISIGTLVGGMQVYLPNLGSRSLFVTNGGRDPLYPAEEMLPMMRLAIEEGAGIYFTAYDTAGHNWGYMSFELPLVPRRVRNTTRPALQPHLCWEASDLHFGRVDWLEITTMDTTAPEAEWHRDVSYTLIDERISVGFFRKGDWEGEGMLVDSLVSDTAAPSHKMGMLPGDVVVELDSIAVKSLDDYLRWRETKKRGDEFSVTVIREESRLKLSASLPPPKEREAFPHSVASGSVDAMRIGNHFEVKASRVGGFRIYIHPEMVRLDQPVTVTVNGDVRFEGDLEPDAGFMLDEFIRDRDRRLLWVARLDINL